MAWTTTRAEICNPDGQKVLFVTRGYGKNCHRITGSQGGIDVEQGPANGDEPFAPRIITFYPMHVVLWIERVTT